MNRWLLVCLALGFSSEMTPICSQAAPGDLDLGFGGFGAGGQIQELGFGANAIVIDAQGRLVLAGVLDDTFHVQRRSGFRFSRVEDVSIVIDSTQSSAAAYKVALAPDGKIVVAGEVTVRGRAADFALARLNPDLTLDLTFAEDGVQSSDFHGHTDLVYGLAVQGDNKIIVVGAASTGPELTTGNDYYEWAAERFNEDGSLDRTFDGDGKWTFGDENFGVGASAVVPLSDGKILIGGTICTGFPFCDNDFGTVRLNPNGSLDGAFGDDGVVDTGFGDEEGITDLALTPDGRIVAAGRYSMARYLSNGGFDPSFGTGGRLTLPMLVNSIIVQPDGKIVVSGDHLRRYNVNGSADEIFAPTVSAIFRALALQPDGLLIALTDPRGAVRLRWDGSLDTGGIVDVVFDPKHTTSTAMALAVQRDGKLVAAGEVYPPNSAGGSSFDVGVTRFRRDRHDLDVDFGTDIPRTGRTLYGLAGTDEVVQALALDGNGKAVVTGRFSTNALGSSVLAGRLTADGAPDPSCAGSGFTRVVIGNVDGTGRTADVGSAVAVGPDNKIYVAGTVRGATNTDFGLARLKEDCSIDRADGLQRQDYNFKFDLGGDENLAGILLQGARVVMAGTSGHDVVLVRFGVDRFGTRMVLDQSFGVSGRASLATGFDTRVIGLVQQSDGKLIVGGWLNRGGNTRLDADFLVARFMPGGALDSTFGDNGVALADFGPFDVAYGVAVRSDDTIAVGGCTGTGAQQFAVAQFDASGHLDSGLRGDGKVTLRLGAEGNDCARAVTFVGPNHLMLGGYSSVFGKPQFALASIETTHAELLPVACVGDCNGDGLVTVDELVTLVNIALGVAGTLACEAGDANQDGQVTIDEIVMAVNAALTSCPTT